MGSSHACARVGGEFSDTELSCENADVDKLEDQAYTTYLKVRTQRAGVTAGRAGMCDDAR